MKTKMLFIAILLVGFFGSCEEEDLSSYERPTPVKVQPEALEDNNYQVIIESIDLKNAKLGGTYQVESVNEYYDDWGNRVIDRSYSDITYYTITAASYWGWWEGTQYCSDYKLKYQLTAQLYAQLEERLQNTRYVICYMSRVSGEWDRFGYGQEINYIVR